MPASNPTRPYLAAALLGLLASTPCAFACTRAHAQDTPAPLEPALRSFGEHDAEPATSAGMFLRFTESPSTETHGMIVESRAVYDSSRSAGMLETRGEAVLLSRRALGLALRGGGTYVGPSDRLPESSHAFGGIKVQPVFQQRHGVDLALAVSYLSRGFNLRPAVASELQLARSWGATRVLCNLVYGQGLSDNERYGALRAGVLRQLGMGLHVGLDGRLQADLELDSDEPEAEPELEAQGGALLSYALSHFTLSATAGPAALRYRQGNRSLLLGAAVSLGVGLTL